MRTFLLQDWTTVRSSLTTAFIQDCDAWLDLDGFSDVTLWVDIGNVTTSRGGNVQLQFQTSPSLDDANFVSLASPIGIGTAAPFVLPSSTPTVVRSALSTTTNNLMRYVRWNLQNVGTGTWDLTFRVHAIAARSTTFVPPLLGGCVIWYRGDLGITLSGTGVSQWNDQSGTNDSHKNLTGTNIPGYNSADSNYNGQPTLTFIAANSRIPNEHIVHESDRPAYDLGHRRSRANLRGNQCRS